MTARSFDDIWAVADRVTGWLSPEQARLLHGAASALGPASTVVEIGSYEGRSTLVLAHAVAGRGSRVVAVDPWIDTWKFGRAGTRERFDRGLRDAGLSDVVEVFARRSQDVRPEWRDAIDLLYVDGKHDALSVLDDLLWVDHVRPGGAVLVHDAFSSVGVTLGILVGVLPRGRLRYTGRVGSLAMFRRDTPSFVDRTRLVRQVPWWLRNLVVKVTLRLRLTTLTRALGHNGTHDPY